MIFVFSQVLCLFTVETSPKKKVVVKYTKDGTVTTLTKVEPTKPVTIEGNTERVFVPVKVSWLSVISEFSSCMEDSVSFLHCVAFYF